MRRVGLMGLAVGFILVAGLPSHAGLYDPRQPTSPLVTERGVRAIPFEPFKELLADIVMAANPPTAGQIPASAEAMRKQLADRRTSLLARGSALLPTDSAELAFVQFRLRQTDAALDTLKRAYGRDPRNFWVIANLGIVYQATGRLQEAAPYVDSARDSFPKPWPGGQSAAEEWFKKVERYQSLLLRSRLKEGARRPTRAAATDVDPVFDARFVDPSGKFEAGKLADAEKAKIPADAVAIVQQLLLWFPDDSRLLWLLGELYNAEGDLDSAFGALQECVWTRRYDSPVLRERRKVLIEARDAAARAAIASNATDAPKESLLPDRTTQWLVGGIFGVVMVALGWWQVREISRRLRGSTRPSS